MSEDGEHCVMGVEFDDDDFQTPRNTSCTDIDGGGECVHCECCCSCLACEYGPRDGLQLTAEQRAPIAAMTFGSADIPPKPGSPS